MKTSVIKFFAGSAIRLAVLAVLLLGMAGVCQAQAAAAAARPDAPAAVAPQAQPAAQTAPKGAPAAKGNQEGIKVHGHWTIEVKNPDGKVATHREFENALYGNGAQVIGQLLSNTYVQGSWVVYLCQSGGSAACPAATSPPVHLVLEQAGSALATITGCTSYCSPTLTVSPGTSGTTVSLTGSIASSPESGSIDTVTSVMAQCPSTVSQSVLQSTCFATTGGEASGTGLFPFTNAYLTSTVPVAVGQSVAVTVTFSFTSQ